GGVTDEAVLAAGASPAPPAVAGGLDAVGLGLQFGELTAGGGFDRREQLTLLPADVVVQSLAQRTHPFGVRVDLPAAGPGLLDTRPAAVVLFGQSRAAGVGGERPEQPLLVVEVLGDVAVPRVEERGDGGAAVDAVAIRGFGEVSRLHQADVVVAGERLQR